jgi:hypothetical protein
MQCRTVRKDLLQQFRTEPFGSIFFVNIDVMETMTADKGGSDEFPVDPVAEAEGSISVGPGLFEFVVFRHIKRGLEQPICGCIIGFLERNDHSLLLL